MVETNALVPARRRRAGTRLLSLVLFAALATSAVAADAPLQFRIDEGRVLNAFYQHGPIAAHLLLSDGRQPRILTAFPAGNSGVGLWFETTETPAHWALDTIEGVSRKDARGRTLRGIVATASIDTPLVVRDAVLSSVRILRDYQINGTYPAELTSSVVRSGDTVTWSRARLDGEAGYSVSIAVANGRIRGGRDTPVALSPARTGETMRLTLTALTGDEPLTPLGSSRLLNASANEDTRSQNVLRFLSYEEKFLAGSWRFNTYFGRDTLMSLRLLMPALESQALERGLASVLQRLASNGEVAHEEDIGEFAVLRHRKQGDPANDTPIYDYNMIDDDFMLPAVAAAYLFDHPDGRARAEAFLAHRLPSDEAIGAALARNFTFVTQSARAFARKPTASNLISLKPGLSFGQWRDSQDGLAGGRYPFDVNAVLVPAAMNAIARLVESGVLKPYLTPEQRELLAASRTIADVWAREAPALFRVRITEADARKRITAYASKIGVSPTSALAALPSGELIFEAIALDADHEPIPVLHSDGGFALLLQNPPAARVDRLIESMLRPFPAGLLTEAGLLVANPAFADATIRRKLDRTAYHGTVVWSWQQALLAAGLDRQLARNDLPTETKARLRDARRRLWSAIDNTRDLRASELWSWRYRDGRYEPVPFGQSTGDADESNAAQLWSTVYLALSPPQGED